MKGLGRLIEVWLLVGAELFLLALGIQSSNAFSSRTDPDTVAQIAPAPALTLTPTVFLPLILRPPKLVFSDEFDGNALDPAKWITKTGAIAIANGKLILSEAEIQSTSLFTYGVLHTKIESPDWKMQQGSPFTDASFGFERWLGVENICHYGALIKANGVLGILQSEPDENNDCRGQNPDPKHPNDPKYQEYRPIPEWDNAIEPAPKSFFITITWAPSGVTLCVSDGGAYSEIVTSTLVPTAPLNIRLNTYWTETHTAETYMVDYVKVYQLP